MPSAAFLAIVRPPWLREKINKGDSMPQPVCPKWSSNLVKRVSRVGLERLISLFYIYPFKCQPCGHRFRLLQWGAKYTRIELDQWGVTFRQIHRASGADERRGAAGSMK